MPDSSNSSRTCIEPARAHDCEPRVAGQGCSIGQRERRDQTDRTELRCTQPSARGMAEYGFDGDKRVLIRTRIELTQGQGVTVIESTQRMRWSGPDCAGAPPAC